MQVETLEQRIDKLERAACTLADTLVTLSHAMKVAGEQLEAQERRGVELGEALARLTALIWSEGKTPAGPPN